MSCVNISSKEFKDTVVRLNVSSENLEVIIHDIQNSMEDENYFPSDAEILENLKGSSFKASSAQVKLYELKGLNKPMEFGNVATALQKVNELKQWFPEEAIHCYKNARGSYEVHVATPLDSKALKNLEDKDTSDYTEEMQSIKSQAMADGTFMKAPNGNPTSTNDNIYQSEENYQEGAKLKSKNTWKELIKDFPILESLSEEDAQRVQESLEKYIADDSTRAIHLNVYTNYFSEVNENGYSFSTVGETLDNIIKNTNNSEVKALAEFAKKYVNDKVNNVSITYSNESNKYERGSYNTADREILVHRNAASGRNSTEAKASFEKVMLHEIIHAITVDYLASNIKAKAEIAKIMQHLDNAIKSGNKELKPYALKNVQEFIAEFMSKPTLREALKLIPYQDTTKSKKSVFHKIMDVIKNAFLKLVGKESKGTTLYDKAVESLTKIMEDSYSYQGTEASEETFQQEEPKSLQPKKVDYIPIGKQKQTYSIEGARIYNKNGVEVFHTDSKDRRKIFAKLALQEGRAVIVDYNGMRYIVNNRDKILSIATGNFVWENTPENGVRIAIVEAARQKFREKQFAIQSAQSVSTEPINIGTFVNHSGGAIGSDSYWGETGEKYGVVSKHYHAEGARTPKGNTPVSRAELQDADEHLKRANETLGRRFPTSNEYVNNLLRRNWQQVKNSDEVFAISTIKNNLVEGGTGWAVQMAIDTGKPVHVFDQNTNSWYTYENGSWVKTETPVLTPNFAGIGTRQISEAGKKAIEEVYEHTKSSLGTQEKPSNSPDEIKWARTATNSYEVSTQGDSRFSALRAKFKPGTIIDGVDVSGMTIENVYQSVIKKSGKGKAPSADSKLYNPELKTKAEQEDFSYRKGYLPLWQEWARQNPELMQELREKSAGKVLTDMFANTRVSQARALADILNSESVENQNKDEISIDSLISELDPSDVLGNTVLNRAKNLGIKVKKAHIDSDRVESGISGQFKADESTIYIDPDNMQENTLIHEAIHSITSYYFNADRKSLPKEIQAALKEIEYCHELLKQDFIEENFYENGKLKEGVNVEKAFSFWIDNDSYGLTSPEEMIAELGKPAFLNRIRRYDAKHKGDKSIFAKLINAIARLFTSKEYSSVEKTIKDAMMVLFNTPNKELFNKHSNEIKTIKENYKTLKSVDRNVITIFPAPKVAEMLESSIGDEMKEYTITLDPYTIGGMFRPEGSKNFLTKPAPNTIIEVQVGNTKGLLVLTKPAEVISKEEGVKLTVVPLNAHYLKNNNLEIRVDNHVAHLVNFTIPSDIVDADGSINFNKLEKISDRIGSDRFYEGNITPDENTIFVFGSNPEGRHGAGAAKVAREQFGAQYGIGEGLTGNSYALPTKDLRVKENRGLRSIPRGTIVESIQKLYETARTMPDKKFKVAYRNTDTASLNGYTGLEMIDMFKDAGPIPSNIIFSKEWVDTGKIDENDFYKGDISEATENRVLAFSGEFEGASNNLVGIVPEPLLSKVEDYIMSGGQIGLSEADAQQFLNYAETAYAEQETTNQEQQPIKKENQTYMEKAVTITQQVNNLYNSTVLTATEIRHVAEQAVYWISDAITEYQENPESLFVNFPEKRTMEGEGENAKWTEENKAKDIEKVKSFSRAEIAEFIGPDNLWTLCKERCFGEKSDVVYEDLSAYKKAPVIYDNFEAIKTLASDVFLNVEDFTIVSSKDGTASTVRTDLVADADNFGESNMQADVAEKEGDTQEHWQVETRTLDVLATMSELVRRALNKCYLIDKNGNNIKSEFGINERVNVREATNSILRWTQGAINLEQVIAKLQKKADSNPWVKQVIDRLSDTSGEETDFQSQFFSTFYKPFQSYSVVTKDKKTGIYKSISVNEHPALTEATNTVISQYKIGEHPLFTTDGVNKTSFNDLKSAFKELTDNKGKEGYDLTNTETKEEAARTLGYISNLLGYYVSPEIVSENLNEDTFKKMYSAINYIIRSLEKNLNNPSYDPFDFQNGIKGNIQQFLKPITDHLEDIAVSAFYDSGKMYQSYTTPSYMSKLLQKFGQEDQASFDKFIMDEYGNYSWFHTGTSIERGWRNEWLKLLATDEDARKKFKHKVQLNFNKHNYMKNMNDMEYTLSVLTEFFSESARDTHGRSLAWYKVPMLSNKPSSEFIRFYSYRGANYREVLTNLFKNIFDQELSRIQTVEMRNFSKTDPRFIKNFDTNGRKFMFLDFMNDYLKGGRKEKTSLGRLIRMKLDGYELSPSNEMALLTQVKEAIMKAMEEKAESIVSKWEKQGLFEGAKKIANIGTKEGIRESLKNFVWNDTFAAMNIMQLTITDLAFYKDAEDLQKRLAQIHAPGVRGNDRATDYEGNPVTDGKFRTIKLTDFDTFISNIIDNVSIVFDRKIANAPEPEKAPLRALKDSLVGKDGAFRKINVADAQGYSSPTSYRKKAFIFGKWSRHAEDIYKKLKEGTYTYSDLQVAFQPLKPFVYSQITKDVGVRNAPLGKLKVPVQYKNSEYLLIMADALLQGENTGKPNLLKAIYEVMEESHFDENGNYKTDGIDTVQFESTVKSGLMGKVSLNDLINNVNGEAIAKTRLRTAIYDETGQYNNSTVDTVPFEDYCLQQEVPEHFKEHEQAHGSQLRYIIVSELANEASVTYNLEGRQVSAKEFKAEYESTIAENIQESIDELAEELSLNDLGSIKDRNIALSKILQREILSSPRYGVDLLLACSVDENGRFRIPLGDPIQSKRVEQLINSIIKNRVNKQKIPGGPVVQVTNFGTSRELNIRFKDKNGDLLMTRAEWEKSSKKRKAPKSLGITMLEAFREDPRYKALYESLSPEVRTLMETIDEEMVNRASEGKDTFIPNTLENSIEFLEKAFGNKYIKHNYTAVDVKEDVQFDLSEDYNEARMDLEDLKKKHKDLNLKFEDFKDITAEGKAILNELRASDITQSIYDIVKNIKEEKQKIESEPNSYEDYIKENQAGIAYFEVFAPMYTNKLFNKFADKNGVINIQAIEMLDPDLLKMIGYRIPTEDKYSMAPLKIVGFLPREAGDGIMLPNDITLLTGSDFDVDKEYLMRKDYGITDTKISRANMQRILYEELINSQKGNLTYELKNKLNELVNSFLNDPFDSTSLVNQKTAEGYTTMTKRAYNRMLRTYMLNRYVVEKPTEGRKYRNNKIVDMTYEVLTHETSADKMLNPGGFDPQKKMGYLVDAYRLHHYNYTWEQLKNMSIDQLKSLTNRSKNLSYIDTHIQFYKQNSAASSLIGTFAVNRIAHAVIESESNDVNGSAVYFVNVDNVCKLSEPFTVAGMEFGGSMPFDMRYDRSGQLIGKVLGSLVASAADAVKDPVLNLMNINSSTANVLNTLIRLGMPFDDAALFLSQAEISEVLADFSRENITGYKSLSDVIQDRLDKIKKDANIDESSEINREELTREELVGGLTSPSFATSYKVLKALSDFQKIAGAMRMPTFATRRNSISNAVGPLIIDNLIDEYEMMKLSEESNIVDSEGNPVHIGDIFDRHPIIGKFQKTVDIARQLFGNMPANSTGFRNILNKMSETSLLDTILKNRKLLSSLSDFYQSYIVMEGGVVTSKELNSIITDFPKEFIEKKYKEKYADNILIQSIKYDTNESGRVTLQVNTTGLDTTQKERLSNAWIDLHKVDPELSIKLFKYNFFKGGIGFNPKTFMNLLPVFVKERIPGYVDAFRVLPSTVPEIVISQFLRNNWDNDRLVLRKNVTINHFKDGTLQVFKKKDIKSLKGVKYFKTKVPTKEGDVDKMFRVYEEASDSTYIIEVTPLGNNKEYLEIGESASMSPLRVPSEATVETPESMVGKESELPETGISTEAETSRGTTDEARLEDLLYKVLVIKGIRTEEQAEDYIKNYKAKSTEDKLSQENQIKKFFRARFKVLGIKFDEKLVDDTYKLMC